MKNSILAKMGLMMKSDKVDLDQRLDVVEQKILDNRRMLSDNKIKLDRQGVILTEDLKNLESIVIEMGTAIGRIDRKLDIVDKNIMDSHVETTGQIVDSYTKVSDKLKGTVMNLNDAIGNNRKILYNYIQEEQRLLGDINQKLAQQSCDAISVKNTCQNIYEKSCDIDSLIGKLYENKLTKEDMDVVESFLRLIAANQLMQEAYYSTNQ